MQENNDSTSPTLEAAKDFIRFNYTPVDDYKEATLRVTTLELFEKLFSTFPAEGFTSELLFTWLNELGFSYMDGGNIRLEWLMKKNN